MDGDAVPDVVAGRASEAFSDYLRELILTHDLPSGVVLPPERALVESTGLGRSSVREALRILEAEGHVRRRPGRRGGLVVSLPDANAIVKPLRAFVQSRAISPTDIVATREVIEPACAALAARHHTPADLKPLWDLNADMSRMAEKATSQESLRNFLATNLAWHKAIINASHNGLLVVVTEALSELILTATDQEYFGTPEIANQIVAAHDRITAAIAAGDAETAQRRMQRHLHAYRTLLDDMPGARRVPSEIPEFLLGRDWLVRRRTAAESPDSTRRSP